MPKSGGLK